MNESTGYKRPPTATRWKKGQSGNPSGRRRGTLNLRTDLLAELSEVIQIQEGGSARKITKQRALLKSLAARGIKGDARAANLILNLIARLLENEPEASITVDLSAQDEAILHDFEQRLLKKKEAGNE